MEKEQKKKESIRRQITDNKKNRKKGNEKMRKEGSENMKNKEQKKQQMK